jgi:hypothetical protein
VTSGLSPAVMAPARSAEPAALPRVEPTALPKVVTTASAAVPPAPAPKAGNHGAARPKQGGVDHPYSNDGARPKTEEPAGPPPLPPPPPPAPPSTTPFEGKPVF